jgi:PKD repeat protein
MRRWILIALAVVCLLAPSAFGQTEILNNELVGEDGFVSPGDTVIAQEFIVRDEAIMTRQPTTATGDWADDNNATGAGNGTCATETTDGDTLQLGGLGFAIPGTAVILGIRVEVLGVLDDGLGLEIELVTQGTAAPDTKDVTSFPVGTVCGDAGWETVGGPRDLWGRSWTPAQINGDFRVDITADLGAGDTAHVDAIKVHVTYAEPSTFDSVTVWNTAPGADALEGEHVDKIEVIRKRDDQRVGVQSTTSQLAKLASTGVPIDISATYDDFTGEEEYQILIYVEDDVPLMTEFTLGNTVGWVNGGAVNVIYQPNAAQQFQIGPLPDVMFDGLIAGGNVYPDQRFLAGRIVIDANDTPFELTISEVVLESDPAGPELQGDHLDSIEVRRASDGALLGQATSTERAKLTTTGTVIATSSYNRVPAYGEVQLEIWVELKSDTPAGKQLKLWADVEIDGSVFEAGDNVPAGDEAPLYTVGEPGGFEEVNNLDLDGGRVFSGQRFLAQRIELVDDDLDPYDVTVTSLTIQNIAAAASRLADNQIALIEVVRAVDGELMGEVANATGLSAGTLRIFTTDANLSSDDTTGAIELWLTLKNSVPHERTIQLLSTVWHTEGAETFDRPHGAGPDSAEFATGPTVGQGFEQADPVALDNKVVFQGARFLAQRLELEDDDPDPYDIVVTSLMIRNIAPDSRLADQNVARLEVRRKSDGKLLGSVTDPVGLSLAGVRVTASTNNQVLDDTTEELEIWVKLKEAIPVGRKIQLESVVWHTEGTATFQTEPALVGPATFTTELGDPPTGVDFSWTPTAPDFEEEISFVPAEDIDDPEGEIANAEFRWDFGDGNTEQTVGSATVKHTYGAGGTFSVTLTVTGEDGISSSKTYEVIVEGPPNEPPTIDELTADPINSAVDQDVDFSVTVTDPDQPEETAFEYEWDFGDEATSTVESPTHSFDEAGTYTVAVTVTDARGATDTATIVISVGNEPPTLTGINANPAAGIGTGDEVAFTAVGYVDPDEDDVGYYEWDFGDEKTANTEGATTTHVFAAPGNYTVSVVAVDVRGARSAAKTVIVTVSGPARTILFAFPNPARTVATFTYYLPTGATDPILLIYNLIGELVMEQELPAGRTSFEWDLRTAGGAQLANGLYFCVIDVAGAHRSDVFRLLIVR